MASVETSLWKQSLIGYYYLAEWTELFYTAFNWNQPKVPIKDVSNTATNKLPVAQKALHLERTGVKKHRQAARGQQSLSLRRSQELIR